MQIISYKYHRLFIILKHFLINAHFLKDIDAESPIVIFWGTIGMYLNVKTTNVIWCQGSNSNKYRPTELVIILGGFLLFIT